MQKDVLIVGAGPTGLMLASLLARWGLPPRLIDGNAGPSRFSKATGVQARSLEVFQQPGLADAAVAQGWPGSAVNLFGDGGKIGRVPFGNVGQGLSPFPFILILPQDRTEAIPGQDLRARGGDRVGHPAGVVRGRCQTGALHAFLGRVLHV